MASFVTLRKESSLQGQPQPSLPKSFGPTSDEEPEFVIIPEVYQESVAANVSRRRALCVHPGSVSRVRTDSMMAEPDAMGGYPSQ